MKAIIMAGGEGTRLRPLTCSIPKPMATIGGVPVISHTISAIKNIGITDIAATLLYLPGVIEQYLKDENIVFFHEKKPCGTAGSVKNCESFIDDTFIVISGDVASSFNLEAAIKFHKDNSADATIVLTSCEDPTEYGVVVTDKNNNITAFVEKPSWSRVFSDNINTGIYIFEKHILDLIPTGKSFDFSNDVFPQMLQNNMKLMGFVCEGYWCDIGNPTSYLNCNKDFLDGNFTGAAKHSSIINNSDCVIIQPSIIGDNVTLGDGCTIGPYAIISDNCTIGAGTSIKKSVVYQHTKIAELCEIRGAIISSGCIINESTRIFEGAVIGEGCNIGAKNTINKNVCIWPSKATDSNCVINDNIVWGDFKKDVFSDDGICGQALTEINPIMVTKLASSFGDCLDKKSIVVACNDSTSAKMLKYAFISGAMSTSCRIFDVGVIPQSIWRFATREYLAGGGAYILENTSICKILLSEKNLEKLSRKKERKMEASFNRSDNFPSKGKLVDIENSDGIVSLYRSAIIRSCDIPLDGLSVSINCPDRCLLTCLESALSELSVKVNTGSVSKTGEISFFVSPDGSFLSCSDELSRYHCDEQTQILALLSLGKDTVYISPSFPLVADEIAAAAGIKTIRISEDDNRHLDATLIDSGLMIVSILKRIKEENTTLYSLMNNIPPFFSSITTVSSNCKKGDIMKRLAVTSNNDNFDDEGVKIKLAMGNVRITPLKKGRTFRIIAESKTAEFAKELCNDFSDLIKNML